MCAHMYALNPCGSCVKWHAVLTVTGDGGFVSEMPSLSAVLWPGLMEDD
jgi:hypothetical protein